MLRLSSARLLASTAALLLVSSVAPLSAQKKSVSAPSKPAAKSAAPAAKGSATSASHGAGTAASSHGPTTAGATTHGPTTSGAAHGPTTAGHEAAGVHGPTAGGAHPGAAGHPALAEHGPMAHPGPAHAREVRTAGGGAVRMRPNGRPSDFHDPHRGMDIHHNLGGGRRVMVERPDHSRLYFEHGRRGYISHPYGFHGHEFARRAYYFHGREYNRFYNPYGFHGLHLEVYAPYRYYSPGFYGWAYHPWAAPVTFSWGFNAHPWYGYYGAYFTPYPVYASPSLWLTDYMISQSLEAQYEAAAASGPPPPLAADAAPLTPDVKAMVAAEVQRQLALENTEAQLNAQGQPPDPSSSSIARALSDGQPHTFVAGAEVDVVDTNGAECAITDGDVLELTTPPGPEAAEAQLMVMSSKGGTDCHKRALVNVPLEDLQEMQNHMREVVDQGLGDLQSKHGGLPGPPPSAAAPPVDAAFAAAAPPPEPGGEKELQAQATQADQSESELTQAAGGTGGGPSADAGVPPPPPPADVSINPGDSIASVTAALGQPVRVMNLGPKTVYVYKDMKITFKAGKVSNIE